VNEELVNQSINQSINILMCKMNSMPVT